jgi:hypothetical protein
MRPRFISTVDLREKVPDGAWVPNPVAMPVVADEPDNAIPRFGHFPSDRMEKGTDRILALFRQAFGPLEMQKEPNVTTVRGREAELSIVSGLRHEEARKIMTGCDVIIDQISPYASYGNVSVEGMALGKPVMSSYRPDWYPGCPIVQLGEHGSVEDLHMLASDGDYRRAKGREGREYVARVHEAGTVARQVLQSYHLARRRTTHEAPQAVS